MHELITIIILKLHSPQILLCICFSNTVLSQQCYNQPNCAGDVVSGPTTAEECCIGTDDGMSFGVSGGTCTFSQCVGNWNIFMDMYTVSVHCHLSVPTVATFPG